MLGWKSQVQPSSIASVMAIEWCELMGFEFMVHFQR